MPPRRRSESAGSGEPQSVRISPTDVDPLASLRVSGVAVDLGDRRWVIPPLPAADWLEVLLDEELEPERLFPGLCGPDVIVEVNQLLIDGTVTVEQMQEAIFDLIEAASGRKWWVALRLCRTIRAGWDRVGGELAANGVTPFGVSLSYWLDGAYATCLRIIGEGDPKQMGRFTAQLVQPPPGLARANFDQKRAAEAFRAAMDRGRRAR